MNAGPSEIITIFGSSRLREGDPQYALALELGAQLASRGFTVCTGGYGGVMEAVSRGAKDAGGHTLGIIAEFFNTPANPWVDEVISVRTWQERLFALIQRASGFVACPGGTGTLVELAVVWEMLNKRVLPPKPLVIVGDFWQPVIERVREVETGHKTSWGEAVERLIHLAHAPAHAAEYLASKLSPDPRL
jgi:uncharacterized protein (TIGR00730 family)